jgi:tetratricopeptide (TPR) repeat protein
VSEDLGGLLASGERAAFHGRPEAGIAPLRRAAELASSDGLSAEAAGAGWLLGVCLSSAGRYGSALEVLEPIAAPEGDAAPELQIFAALASASIASVHRQLGRHETARAYDEQGLARTDRTGEAAFDCLLGLAADAVGLGDKAAAQEHLAAAQTLAEGRAEWWRQRVRLGWLDAEVALLVGDGETAATAAEQAVDLAERSGAPRHVAKGLLFLGVALVEAGRLDEAATALKRGGLLAESLGTLPLLWPSRAVLGALLADSDPKQSARFLSSARATVKTIAEDVPDDLRDEWLARPDVGAVLEG